MSTDNFTSSQSTQIFTHFKRTQVGWLVATTSHDTDNTWTINARNALNMTKVHSNNEKCQFYDKDFMSQGCTSGFCRTLLRGTYIDTLPVDITHIWRYTTTLSGMLYCDSSVNHINVGHSTTCTDSRLQLVVSYTWTDNMFVLDSKLWFSRFPGNMLQFVICHFLVLHIFLVVFF